MILNVEIWGGAESNFLTDVKTKIKLVEKFFFPLEIEILKLAADQIWRFSGQGAAKCVRTFWALKKQKSEIEFKMLQSLVQTNLENCYFCPKRGYVYSSVGAFYLLFLLPTSTFSTHCQSHVFNCCPSECFKILFIQLRCLQILVTENIFKYLKYLDILDSLSVSHDFSCSSINFQILNLAKM